MTTEYSNRISVAFVSAGILVALLTGSFLVWLYTRSVVFQLGSQNFKDRSEAIRTDLADQFEQYEEVLDDGEVLFSINPDLPRTNFMKFYEKREETFKGLSAIGFAEKVTAPNEFLDKVKNDTSVSRIGYPNFRIYPESEKPEYFVINYLTNAKENQSLFGFDLSSNKLISEKIEESARKNKIVMVRKQLLINVERTLILEPVYKSATYETMSEEQRREDVRGFVVAIINTDKLAETWLSDKQTNYYMQVQLYEETFNEKQMPKTTAVIDKFLGTIGDKLVGTEMTKVSNIKAIDDSWTVVTRSSYATQLGWFEKMLPNLVFFVDSFASVILAILIFFIWKARKSEIM